MAGWIFKALMGQGVPGTIEEVDRIVERVIKRKIPVTHPFPGVTDAQGGIFPLSYQDPEQVMRKIFPNIKKRG